MNQQHLDKEALPFSVTITEGFSIQVPIEEIPELRRKARDDTLERSDISSFQPERCHYEANLWDESPRKERIAVAGKILIDKKPLTSPVTEVCFQCVAEFETRHVQAVREERKRIAEQAQHESEAGNCLVQTGEET